jgi:nucleoid-associated protein YgaU
MPTTRSPAAAAALTLARMVKAVLAVLVLAATVAGLPVVLTWATPVIWAATHDDLTHLLDRQDTGSFFLLLLACVGWIGWAQFSFCALRELIAQLQGRTWHPPRGMGTSQRAASLLIGSILVLLPTSSALAFDAQAAPAPTAGRVSGQTVQAPQAAAQADHASPASSTSTPVSHLYTVRETRPAESLWGIAEHELGNGERWREIAALNEGRTMTDGTIFRANSFLQPSWQLQMPKTATTAGDARTQLDDIATAADDNGGHLVTVHSGDYLSKIAEQELGDGDDWPRLFEASRGKPQPHGLPAITDPDVIYAGQQVTVPGTHTAEQSTQGQGHGEESGSQETTPPTTQNSDATQKPDDSTGGAPAPVSSQTQAPTPQSSTPTAPSSRPAEQPGQDQPALSQAASATPEPSTSAPASAAAPPDSSPDGSR